MRNMSTFDPTYAYDSLLINYNYITRRVAGFVLFYKGGIDWNALSQLSMASLREVPMEVHGAWLFIGLLLLLRIKPSMLKKKG